MNHHGIIDHDPDRQDQCQHGDIIEREAHVLHEEKGRNDRSRDRQGRNDGGAPVPDKQHDRGRDQHGGQQQVEIDFGHRFADESGLILDDFHLNVGRQRLRDAG